MLSEHREICHWWRTTLASSLLPCPGRSLQSGNVLCPSLHHLICGAVCVFSGNSPLSWSSSSDGHCVVLPAKKHHELYHSHRGSAQEEPRCLPFSLKDGLPMAEAGPSTCWKEEATWAFSKKLSSDATLSPLDISSGDTGAVRAPAHVCCQLCMQLTLPELWIQMLVFCKYFFPFWLIFKMHFETQRVICFNYIWCVCVYVYICAYMWWSEDQFQEPAEEGSWEQTPLPCYPGQRQTFGLSPFAHCWLCCCCFVSWSVLSSLMHGAHL